jgi:hypothetical protein
MPRDKKQNAAAIKKNTQESVQANQSAATAPTAGRQQTSAQVAKNQQQCAADQKATANTGRQDQAAANQTAAKQNEKAKRF